MRNTERDFTHACELTLAEIESGEFTHDGAAALGRHVVNARNNPNRWGNSIGKESRSSPRKIDAAVAMVIARHARRLVLAERAKLGPEKDRRVRTA
jgi:phage terminase large subunit-like protein